PRLADRKPADRVAGKIERDDLACAPLASFWIRSALHYCKDGRFFARARSRAAFGPFSSQMDRSLDRRRIRGQLHTHVEHHPDVDADRFLKCNHVLRREAMLAAVEM